MDTKAHTAMLWKADHPGWVQLPNVPCIPKGTNSNQRIAKVVKAPGLTPRNRGFESRFRRYLVKPHKGTNSSSQKRYLWVRIPPLRNGALSRNKDAYSKLPGFRCVARVPGGKRHLVKRHIQQCKLPKRRSDDNAVVTHSLLPSGGVPCFKTTILRRDFHVRVY